MGSGEAMQWAFESLGEMDNQAVAIMQVVQSFAEARNFIGGIALSDDAARAAKTGAGLGYTYGVQMGLMLAIEYPEHAEGLLRGLIKMDQLDEQRVRDRYTEFRGVMDLVDAAEADLNAAMFETMPSEWAPPENLK